MTSTHNSAGRLGNQIFRNMAVSQIAQKHDLFVDYSYKNLIDEQLGIPLFVGSQTDFETMMLLNDDNFFQILNMDHFPHNLNPKNSFFQTKEISNLLYRYIRSDSVKQRIMSKNTYSARYQNNNDVFIHIRLTDAAHLNPGSPYYLKALTEVIKDKLDYNLFISTDQPDHPIIHDILAIYNQAQLINYDEITTFQFASTCKTVILSHGSFSALIGYLAFFSVVYYPMYEEGKGWYGDMFSIDGWNRIVF